MIFPILHLLHFFLFADDTNIYYNSNLLLNQKVDEMSHNNSISISPGAMISI